MSNPFLSIIVATGDGGEIGFQGDMPWGRSIPGDLAYFKSVTWGKPLIMGRKTYESIRKPLPGRTSIVVSRTLKQSDVASGVLVVDNIVAAISEANAIAIKTDNCEVFVIGGAEIYRQTIDHANYIYWTQISDRNMGGYGYKFEADTFFPEMKNSEWEYLISRQIPHPKDKYVTTFHTMVRK